MRTLITIILFALTLGVSYSQQLRCLSSGSFHSITNGGDLIKIQKPISICYDDMFFSFYSPHSGTRIFKISNRSSYKDSEGFISESFTNSEDFSTPHGFYSVQIAYGEEKMIIISFTKTGVAYIIKGKSFLGQIENTISEPVKKTISALNKAKTDTIPNLNISTSPKLKYCDATTEVNINDYVNNKLGFKTDSLKDFIGEINFTITIGVNGQILNAAKTGSYGGSKLTPDLIQKTVSILENMPPWNPALNQSGKEKQVNCYITVIIGQK